MINITKQGNNVIVTSDNPSSFNISNGELSVPLNTIYYVLDDESDFIQFNSTEEGNILFNGTIGQIQVNGNIVTRDNILMELDNVFNSAAIAGEGGTAGVLSINGYDGYINLKSINGQSLIGSGDITIEGGSSTESDPIFTEWKNSMNVSLGKDSSSEETSISIGSNAASVGQSIAIGRGAENTTFDQVAIGYNIKNDDTYYTNINNVLKGDENKYAYIKDNDGNYTKILDLIKGGSVEETDPIFTEWKNGSSTSIGQNNTASNNGVNIGANNGDADASILIGQYLSGNSGSIIIGADTKSYNDGEILLGNAASSIQGETHVAFAKYGSSYGAEQNCFEITQDNSIYIWNADNTQMIKLQDHLGGGGGSVEESDPIFTEWKDDTSIVCGNGAVNGINNFGVLVKRDNAVAIGNGASTQTDNSIAIGNNAKTFGSTATSSKGLVAIGNEVSISAIANDSTINKYVKTNINNQLKFATDDTMYIKGMSTNGTSNNWFIVNGEWTGTQSQYDALGTYYNNVTYNIIEG